MPYYGNWPSIDCQNQIIVTVRLTYKCLVINRVFKIRRDPCWWTSDASLAFLPSRFEPFDQTWEITDQRLVGWWPNLLSSWPTQTDGLTTTYLLNCLFFLIKSHGNSSDFEGFSRRYIVFGSDELKNGYSVIISKVKYQLYCLGKG